MNKEVERDRGREVEMWRGEYGSGEGQREGGGDVEREIRKWRGRCR